MPNGGQQLYSPSGFHQETTGRGNSVVTAWRKKYPEYKWATDDELTRAIGAKYPEYLSRPDFAKDYERLSPRVQTPTEQAQPARTAPEEDLSWYEYPAHAYSKFTESIVEGFTAIPEVIGLAEYNLYRKLGIDYDLDDSYFTKAAKTAKEVGAVGSGTRSFTSPVRTMEREQLQDSFWASDVPAGLGSVVGYATGRKFVTEPLKQGFKHFGREVSKGVPQAQALRALPTTAQQTVRGATIDMAGSLSQSVAMGQTEAWADAYGTLMAKAQAEGRTQLNDEELDTAFEAMMWGTGSGLTEMYGANRIALKLFKRLDRTTGGAWGKGLLHVVKETAKGGAEEAAQEVIQNSWLNFTASTLAKYDENRKLADGVVRSGEVGGTVGAIFGLMLGARRMRAQRRDRVVAKIEERTGKPITPELLTAVEEDLAASDITPKQLEFMLEGVTGEEVAAVPETAAPALGVSPATDEQRVVMGHVEGESKKVAGAENVVVHEGGTVGQSPIYAKRDLTDEIHIDPVALEDAVSDLTPAQKKTYVRKAIEEEVAHNGTIAVKHEEWTKKFAGKKGAPEFWEWYNSEMAFLAAEITPEQAAKVKKGYGREDMTDTQLAEEYMRRLLQEERTGSSTESVWQEVGKLDNPLTRNWFKKVINFVTGKHGKTKLTRSLLTRLHRVHDKLDKKAKAGKKTREAAPVEAEEGVDPVESELPSHLRGAKPRYGYRHDNFELEFESDTDKALYIVSQKTKSKRDGEYMDFLKGVLPGKTDLEIRALGSRVRNNVIKPKAKSGSETGVLNIEETGLGRVTEKPVAQKAEGKATTEATLTPEQIHEKALKALARRTGGLEAGEASRVEAIAMRRLESMLTGDKPVPKSHVNKKIKQAIDDGLKGRTRTERDTRLEGEKAGEPVAVESPVAAAEKADVAGLNIRGRAKRIMSKLKRPKGYVNDLVSVMEGTQTQAELAAVHGLRKDTVSRDMKRLQTELKSELEEEGVAQPSDIISAPVPRKAAEVTDEGSAFFGKQSGESVTFDFIRNTEQSPKLGPTYGQDKEPTGRYLTENQSGVDVSQRPGWEAGTVTFDNPLLISWGSSDEGYSHPGNWKSVLAEEYGARGSALSKKIREAGYDGIVTVNPRFGSTSEIVDLTRSSDIISAPVPKKRKTSEQSDVAKQISTRNPTAVNRTEDPLATNLVSGVEPILSDPKIAKSYAQAILQYVGFKSKAKTDEGIIEDFIQHAVDNLLWLHDSVSPDIRNRSRLWYDGARKLTEKWSRKHKVSREAVAGVLASLSPQMDWFQNVSLAERVITIVTQRGSVVFDNSMAARYVERLGVLSQKRLKQLKADIKAGKITEADAESEKATHKRRIAKKAKSMRGKTLDELTEIEEKAIFVRFYDEVSNSTDYDIVAPEGKVLGKARNAPSKKQKAAGEPGDLSKVGWGSMGEVEKAVSILITPARENISARLGDAHKVRNFFNNILLPNTDKLSVTIDTHAVAAALLQPLAGKDLAVKNSFGQKVDGGVTISKSSLKGIQGVYGVYAEAYQRAAEARGLLPREMQSITWEAVRGLFPAGWKANKSNKNNIDNIWSLYENGKQDVDGTRLRILEETGGITAPAWFAGESETGGLDPDTEVTEEAGRSGDPSQLPLAGVRRPVAQADSGGVEQHTGVVPVSGGDTRGRVKGEDLIISAPTPRKGKTRADLATEAREAVKNRAEGKTEQEALIEWSDTLSNDEMILFRYGTEGDTDLGPDETKQRLSATKTIAETIATEPVAEELRAFDDAYYDPIKNDETMAEAEAFVEEHGVTEAERIVGDSTRQASALDTAVRIVLIGKHQQAGNHEEAVVVAFNAAERAKEQGQAIQVLSILRRLSPEGALIYATRVAQTAKDNAPNEAAKAAIDKRLEEKAKTIREKAEKLREMEESAEQKSGAVEATKAELDEANKALEKAQAELKEARAELRAARSAKSEGLGSGKGEGLGPGKGKGKGEGEGKGKGEGKGEPEQGELFTEPTPKRRKKKTRKEEQLELIAEEEVAKVRVRKKLTEAQKAERAAKRAEEKAAKAEAAIQEKHSQVEDADRLIAAAELMDEIHSVVPVGIWEKVKIIQTMAMLLNPKTALRNIGGNIILFGVNFPVEFLEIPIDIGLSFVTGRRTTTLAGMLKDRWKGLKQPVGEVKEWYESARAEGKDTGESIAEAVSNLIKVSRLIAQQKYEMSDISRMGSRVFDSKGMRMLEDLLAFELSVIDRQFWLAAYHREIGIQLKTRDIVVPDKDAIESAIMEANYAIYQDENVLSNSLQAMRSIANRIFGAGGKKVGAQRQGGWGLGDALIKFTQVPGSILMRGLEFSPAGFFSVMYEGGYQPLVNKKFDQRAFTKAFSRATVGSGGLVGVGAWLFAMGIITAADDEDRKLRELNRERGIMKYSVNVSALKRLLLTGKKQTHQRGDLQFSYDWAQPLATPVAIGAGMWQEHERINRDIKNNNTTSVPSAVVQMWHMGGKGIKGASRTIEEQPIFSGLQQGMRGYHYADRDEGKMYSAFAAVAENVPRTFVPTITKQLAQVDDSTIRERRASDMVTRIVNGIGADLGMDAVPEKPGLYGQTVRKYESDIVANRLFLSLFSPANVRTIKNDPVLDEVFRLYQVTGETGHWPMRKSIKITVDGKKRVLTPQEVTDYQHLIGEKSRAETLRIIRGARYNEWTESAKQSAIQRVVRDSAQAARIVLFQQPTSGASKRARFWANKMKRQAKQ